MGATMSHGSGVWKACPICGKLFFIASRETWVYKRWSDSGPCYFHTWSCMRKYEEQHANDLHEKRVKAAKIRHNKAVKPTVVVKTRTSMRYCGKCGKRVFLKNDACTHCGTQIDWSEYRRKEKKE